jgi:hypothetical protein
MADELKPPEGGLTPAGGVRPASRIVGPVAPAVYTAGTKTVSVRAIADTPEPLVTEGMKARQRDIEKKRRVVATLRAVADEEAAERWGRGRTWIFRAVGILIAFGVYLKLQSVYGDKWPILAVWVFLALLLGVAVSWLLWYLDYSD